MTKPYVGNGTSFTATIPNVINDNDPLCEKYLAPPVRRMADQVAFLYRKRPSNYSYVRTAANVFSGGAAIASFAGPTPTTNTIPNGIFVDVPNCAVGDTVQVASTVMLTFSNGSPNGAFDVWINAIDNYGATSPQGQETHIPGAHAGIFLTAGGISGDYSPQSDLLVGTWTVLVPGTTRFTLAVRNNSTNGTLKIDTDVALHATRYPL